MKFFVSTLVLMFLAIGTNSFAGAEIKVDESLKKNYSYINEMPELKPEAMTFLMIEAPGQKITTESKAIDNKSQCSITNKLFVNCRH